MFVSFSGLQKADQILLDSDYAHDDVFMIHDVCPTTLIQQLTAYGIIAHNVCASHSLKINFALGKTECVLVFRGPESVAAKKDMFITRACALSLGTLGGRPVSLSVVSKYVHMGSHLGSSWIKDQDGHCKVARSRQSAV